MSEDTTLHAEREKLLVKRIRVGREMEELIRTEAWKGVEAFLLGCQNALIAQLTSPTCGVNEVRAQNGQTVSAFHNPEKRAYLCGSLQAVQDTLSWVRRKVEDGEKAKQEYTEKFQGRID